VLDYLELLCMKCYWNVYPEVDFLSNLGIVSFEMKYSNFCREILALDAGIRFAGIAIMEGKIIAGRTPTKHYVSIERSQSCHSCKH
jgi:hypothetical protein